MENLNKITENLDINELLEFLEIRNYKPIEIHKYKTGHLYVDIILNGVEGKFILDTDAGKTVIEEKKKKIFEIISCESDKTATGAGGEMSIQISENNNLKIEHYKIENLQIILMNLDHINNAFKNLGLDEVDGVIGSDILISGKAIIDYTNMVLFLK